MEYSESLLKEYLHRHFMCSVSERYTLLIACGLTVDILIYVNLGGCPISAARDLLENLKNFNKELPRQVFDSLVKMPLPEGIPAPE